MSVDYSNVKSKEFSTSSGKDVTDTQIISGEASETPAQRETNSTEQYMGGSVKFGKLGGKGDPTKG